jgi:hypothetical protein
MESNNNETTIKIVANTWNKNKSDLYDFTEEKDLTKYMAFINSSCKLIRKGNILKQINTTTTINNNEIPIANLLQKNGKN